MSKTGNVARVLEHAGHVLYRTSDGDLMKRLTSRQIQALVAARDKGGAVYGRGHASLMGGAYRRMCEKLALAGLVEDFPPFPITDLGRQALSFYNSPHPNAER